MNSNPYDQLPYRCQPIEWTAPERLALASLLHGGPCPDVQRCRVLELGCGDGSNLLPLAYYRHEAQFIGVDGAGSQIDIAQCRRQQLQLNNVEFLQLDFSEVDRVLDGTFDFIIAHGIFSWVDNDVRDTLMRFCGRRLNEKGLLYLNYNTLPGWNIRGMVREYLLAHTANGESLYHRSLKAQQASRQMAQSLSQTEHPFNQLLAQEFQFVADSHCSYVAHEFLAQHNTAYWRSDFLALAADAGLYHVADADFNYVTGRVDSTVAERIQNENLIGRNLTDTVDLANYRQLHSPVFCLKKTDSPSRAPRDLSTLHVASVLQAIDQKPGWFQHPNGFQVEARTPELTHALHILSRYWPGALPVLQVFQDVAAVADDLVLLHTHGLIELRLPHAPAASPLNVLNDLNRLELEWRENCTTANHVCIEPVPTAMTSRQSACGS